MSKAAPLNHAARLNNYLRQNDTSYITRRQWRRYVQKLRWPRDYSYEH